ncbi:hypothetical protein ABKV19_005726 [Rosa sericea]
MLLQFWSISSCGAFHNSWALTHSGKHHNLMFNKPLYLRKSKPSTPVCVKAQLIDEFAQLAHNKVLVAAGVCGVIGQLSKPFTNVILYGKEFDFKSTLQAGGFPSSHSSAMVATATTLGLERGLSDSIFGLTVVYAGIVMYDAQGVRREAGNHARELNKIVPQITRANTIPSQDRGTDAEEGLERAGSYIPLKETIGHTEVEVTAGALLGFLVGLAVYTTL